MSSIIRKPEGTDKTNLYICSTYACISVCDASFIIRIPPPHLLPFVYYDEGAYVPKYAKTLKHLQATVRKEVLPPPGVEKDLEDPQNLLAEGIIDRAAANEAAEKKQKVNYHVIFFQVLLNICFF
jgi:pescadillo